MGTVYGQDTGNITREFSTQAALSKLKSPTTPPIRIGPFVIACGEVCDRLCCTGGGRYALWTNGHVAQRTEVIGITEAINQF